MLWEIKVESSLSVLGSCFLLIFILASLSLGDATLCFVGLFVIFGGYCFLGFGSLHLCGFLLKFFSGLLMHANVHFPMT